MRQATLTFAAFLMLSASTASADPVWQSTSQLAKACEQGSIETTTPAVTHFVGCLAFVTGVMRGRQLMGENCIDQYNLRWDDLRRSMVRFIEKKREAGSGQSWLNEYEQQPHVVVAQMLFETYPCK